MFCHQSPMVRFESPPPYPVPKMRCELADLLVLHSHVVPSGKEYWRGVLMQAKVCKSSPVKADEPQLCLYDRWPRFSIEAPGFNAHLRDFNSDKRSGVYALVSNAGWHVSPPSKSLSVSAPWVYDLGTFLVEMLYDMDPGQPNRTSTFGRQVYRCSQFDWSPTIWELLRNTAIKPLRHKGKTHGNYNRDLSRLGGGFLQMLDGGYGGTSSPAREAVFEGDGGVSILVIRNGPSDAFDEGAPADG